MERPRELAHLIEAFVCGLGVGSAPPRPASEPWPPFALRNREGGFENHRNRLQSAGLRFERRFGGVETDSQLAGDGWSHPHPIITQIEAVVAENPWQSVRNVYTDFGQFRKTTSRAGQAQSPQQRLTSRSRPSNLGSPRPVSRITRWVSACSI